MNPFNFGERRKGLFFATVLFLVFCLTVLNSVPGIDCMTNSICCGQEGGVLAQSVDAGGSRGTDLLPLEVASNRRYLQRSDGRPFFWMADTAWELFHRLSQDEAVRYLDQRKSQGFNVIQAVLLAEMDGIRVPNRQGYVPFKNLTPLVPNVVPGEHNDYWDDVDAILDAATQRGFYVLLLPTWGEWVTPRFAEPAIFSKPKVAYEYGRFLGDRMKDRTNLIWALGGDRRPHEKPWARDVWNAMAEGITDGVAGVSQFDGAADWNQTLMSYHCMASSSGLWLDTAWLDFHMWGTYHSTKDWARSFGMARKDLAADPNRPTLNSEPCYEEIPRDYRGDNGYFGAAEVRRAAWWSVLSGTFGHTYGAHPIWQMWGTPEMGKPEVPLPKLSPTRMDWANALSLPGAGQMQHLRGCMESLGDFASLRPYDELLVNRDEGTGPSSEGYVACAVGADFAIAYVPGLPVGSGVEESSKRSAIEFQLGRFEGATAQWYWFNPRDGSKTDPQRINNEGVLKAFLPTTDSGDSHRSREVANREEDAVLLQDWVFCLRADK
ncbi:MAG: DUF4038 domain-containing protein [Aureliella sp.]